jgi:hypothetical protein
VQPIWSALGRQVVTNLTTVTTSTRGFTVLLLGRFLAQYAIEKDAAKERDALPIFLRVEQMCAYARHLGHGVEGDIRGIERVKRFLSEGNGKTVPIRDTPQGMILSDQRTYGLWGLYSASARVSGLIAEGPVGLTPRAREFVEKHYWPRLEPHESEILRLVVRGGTLRVSPASAVFQAFVDLLTPRFSGAEKQFYGDTLRDALQARNNPFQERQKVLATLLKEHVDLRQPITRADILTLIRAARTKDEFLEGSLDKILMLEGMLGPAETLFQFLQSQATQRLGDVAEDLTTRWKQVPYVSPEAYERVTAEVIASAGEAVATAMKVTVDCLARCDFGHALEHLLSWNKIVMEQRGSAPWIRVTTGRVDVRYRGNPEPLPDATELPQLWRNSYFIDALREIVHQLQ